MKRLILAMVLSVGLLAPHDAQASITFQYVTNQSSYNQNGTVSVNVFLQETDTGGTGTILGNAGVSGLGSFAIYVTQTAGASSGQSKITGYSSAATPFTSFGTSSSVPQAVASSSSSSTASFGSQQNAIDYFNSVAGGTNSTPVNNLGNGVYQVALGTLSVTAGTATTFKLTSMNSSTLPDNGDNANTGSNVSFTLPSGAGAYNIDASKTNFVGSGGSESWTGTSAAAPFQFTVQTAVPEPSSVILCGLTFGILAFGAYRRRTKNATTEAVGVA